MARMYIHPPQIRPRTVHVDGHIQGVISSWAVSGESQVEVVYHSRESFCRKCPPIVAIGSIVPHTGVFVAPACGHVRTPALFFSSKAGT